jgi:hypothetical protein
VRTPVVSILAVALIFSGCGRPKFIAPSSGSVELASHNGFLWTIPGSPLLDDGTMGAQQNLLYVLVVCPDMAASEKGTETRHGGRINSYASRWTSSRGPVSICLDWDKHTDTVTVGARTFGRSTGSVFVVRREPTGALSSIQLPSPSTDLGTGEALRYIQQHMSTDTVITEIRLPQRDSP